MPLGWVTAVDYIEFDADPSSGIAFGSGETSRPNLGMRQNKPYLKCLGQTSNTTSAVANQPLGVAAIPAIASGAVGTVTVANTLITANSYILGTPMKIGTDTSTTRGGSYWVESQAAGTVTWGIKAIGSAIAVSTWVIRFLIIN